MTHPLSYTLTHHLTTTNTLSFPPHGYTSMDNVESSSASLWHNVTAQIDYLLLSAYIDSSSTIPTTTITNHTNNNHNHNNTLLSTTTTTTTKSCPVRLQIIRTIEDTTSPDPSARLGADADGGASPGPSANPSLNAGPSPSADPNPVSSVYSQLAEVMFLYGLHEESLSACRRQAQYLLQGKATGVRNRVDEGGDEWNHMQSLLILLTHKILRTAFDRVVVDNHRNNNNNNNNKNNNHNNQQNNHLNDRNHDHDHIVMALRLLWASTVSTLKKTAITTTTTTTAHEGQSPQKEKEEEFIKACEAVATILLSTPVDHNHNDHISSVTVTPSSTTTPTTNTTTSATTTATTTGNSNSVASSSTSVDTLFSLFLSSPHHNAASTTSSTVAKACAVALTSILIEAFKKNMKVSHLLVLVPLCSHREIPSLISFLSLISLISVISHIHNLLTFYHAQCKKNKQYNHNKDTLFKILQYSSK